MENKNIKKSELSILASHTQIVGSFRVENEAHVYGKILGELHGAPGSQIILKEGALVEGKVFADSIIVEGFIKGEVIANTSLWVAAQGKIIGTVKTPSLQVEPGAIFEAKVLMNS